jgi:LysR family hydrogen peroxide-inducible transcriptional activator
MRYFEALVAHGHFGRAAEACAITQPALSLQIKELEGALGGALFERGARRVRLTGLGEELAPRIHAVLRAAEALEDQARAAEGGGLGRLRLGVIPTIAPYLLPRMLQALAGARPGLDVHVRETVTPRLIDDLTDGRLDAAVVALPLSEPHLAETPLFTERLVLVRPAAEADRPVPEPEALRAMRLLLLEEGHCFRDQALSFCGLRPASAREGLDGSTLSTLVQMVGAGLGVTIIPEMAVPVEARSAPVAIARFPAPEPARSIGMIWRRASPLSAQLGEIAGILREAAAPAHAP